MEGKNSRIVHFRSVLSGAIDKSTTLELMQLFCYCSCFISRLSSNILPIASKCGQGWRIGMSSVDQQTLIQINASWTCLLSYIYGHDLDIESLETKEREGPYAGGDQRYPLLSLNQLFLFWSSWPKESAGSVSLGRSRSWPCLQKCYIDQNPEWTLLDASGVDLILHKQRRQAGVVDLNVSGA